MVSIVPLDYVGKLPTIEICIYVSSICDDDEYTTSILIYELRNNDIIYYDGEDSDMEPTSSINSKDVEFISNSIYIHDDEIMFDRYGIFIETIIQSSSVDRKNRPTIDGSYRALVVRST